MTPDELQRAIRQNWAMPPGSARTAAAEEVVRHADALGDPVLAFEARMAATEAYQRGGEPAKTFVTFSWCLAEFDRDPGQRSAWDGHLLLWFFKYVVSSLTRFPEVPLDRTYAVLDDMERRFLAGGHSLHAVYQHRWVVAHHLGEMDEAARWYEKWGAAPRDDNSDCVGCDPTAKVTHLASTGRDEEAVALAVPVLAGRLTCDEQPQAILTELLTPYLRTGRLDEARDAHRRAYRSLRGNLADLGSIASHVRFCAVTGNEARGLEIVERHLDWLDRAPSPHSEMYFAAASALVLRRLATSGHGGLTLRQRGSGGGVLTERPIGELGEDLAARATAIAARFDVRNGSPHQSKLVAEWLDTDPGYPHLPLTGLPRQRTPTQAAATIGVRRARVHAPVPVEVDLTVPEQATPDEVLDLADDSFARGRDEQAYALWRLFDDRFAAAPLSLLQQARRVEGSGLAVAGDAHRITEAEEAWQRAIVLYEQAGDTERGQVARGRLGLTRCQAGRVIDGLPMVEESTDYVTRYGNPANQAAAYRRLAVALFCAQRPADALVAVDQALDLRAHALDPAFDAQLALIKAQCLGALDRLVECAVAAEEAVGLFEAQGDPDPMAAALIVLGIAEEAERSPDAALTAFARAAEVASDDGLRAEARTRRARLLAGTPRAADAIDDLVEWVNRVVGNPAEGDQARYFLAVALLNAGRPGEAAESAEDALTGFEARGERYAINQTRRLLHAVYRQLDEPDQALAQLDELVAALTDPEDAVQRGQMQEEAGEILYGQDRDALAAERFTAAAEAYAETGQHLDLARALRRRALALRWAGEIDAAVDALPELDALVAGLPSDPAEAPEAVFERAMLGYDAARIYIEAERLDDALVRINGPAAQFRSIEAFGEAMASELLLGEVLVRLDRPAQAEAVLRRVVTGLPRDSGALPQAVWLLSAALEAQGREDEARGLRDEYGLSDGE